jgi:hypothetical protein
MLIDSSERTVISNLGWVEGGRLWLCDTTTSKIRQEKLGDGKYLSFYDGKEGLFSTVHHFEGNRLEITAHNKTKPEEVLARITILDSKPTFDGDISLWSKLPRAYVAYYVRFKVSNVSPPKVPNNEGFLLFFVDAISRAVELHALDWFDDSYDHGYQGIIGVKEVPQSELLLISIQRDSKPVLYDPKNRKVVKKLTLDNRNGNPHLRFRRTANELWAHDYDTLLKIDPEKWEIKNKIRLQGASSNNTQQFIGDFVFNNEETLCAVARPFSGDVVALDTKTFKVTHEAKIGRQPMDIGILNNGKVFARDWKTGDLLTGQLKKKMFA